MLLTAIQLKNFRQFTGEQKVLFSTDSNKNVTVIMGENGSGKSSFAQAFTWCLYNKTEFKDNIMLNRIVESKMLPTGEETVFVKLDLKHRGVNYSVTRKQVYVMNGKGDVKGKRPQLYISYIAEDGQTKYISEILVENEIEKILPQKLSKYFFFDGERIDKMSDEIREGKGSEFAAAVQRILGLDAIKAAIEHLKSPGSKKSVVREYNHSYNKDAKGKIEELTEWIEKMEEKNIEIDKKLTDIKNEERSGSNRRNELEEEMKKNKSSEEHAKKCEKVRKHLIELSYQREENKKGMLNEFNKSATDYFAIPLMRQALDALIDADVLEKGIPELQSKTIQHLLKRKTCLCGNDISSGGSMEKELNSLLAFVPPKSLGTMVSQFRDSCRLKNNYSADMFNKIEHTYTAIRDNYEMQEKSKDEIETIENQLASMKDVGQLQRELQDIASRLRDLRQQRDDLNQEKGKLRENKKGYEDERKELTIQDTKNGEIEKYKAYAEYLYEQLSQEYKKKETETREKLLEAINSIFKEIYAGGFSLAIDEKYNIKVISDEHTGMREDIETSSAQSLSIIFAFITGVIKIARENSEKKDKMLLSEAYPLLMDAPLSSFDKERIKTLCEVLPDIAEQVIIFIKDTDGEIAEEHLQNKIGKRYDFVKKDVGSQRDEFTTYIEERNSHV